MEDRHRTILRKGRVILIKDLCDVKGLCDKLLSYGVLTENMVGEILGEKTTSDQARKLLDILPRRGKNAYGFFYQALVESGQSNMADLLKPELARSLSLDEKASRYDKSSFQKAQSSPVEYLSPTPGTCRKCGHPSEGASCTHCIPPFEPETLNPLEVKLKPCNRAEIYQQHEGAIYQLESNPRGKAIIINIFEFDDQNIPRRDQQAHAVSSTSIYQLFKELKFKVETKSNVTGKELLTLIENEQKSSETYDCFVMVILTHGSKDLIFMKDGAPLNVQNIIEQFDANNCPNLQGKPKLFFIHACPSDSEQAPPESFNVNSLLSHTEEHHKLTKADIFVAKAVQYDPIVVNEECKGFRFIQAFVHIMKHRAHKDHLQELFTHMNSLAEEDKQLADTADTLRKSLFFFP